MTLLLHYLHVFSKRAILAHETFDFCKDIVANVPDPVEGDGEEEKRAGKRRKVDKKEDA